MAEKNRVSALLAVEHTYRWVLLDMLWFCATPRGFKEVQEHFLALLEKKASLHTPDILLHWLEESGGIERIQVDGEGMWQLTPTGALALEAYSHGQPLRNLITEKPELRPVFLCILEFCQQPRQRQEIEQALAGDPALQRSRLHPAYFISELEKYGGLEWSGRRWLTTSDGRGVLV